MISIIVPCYLLSDKDCELLTFTQNFVKSLRTHVKVCYELILVDNGSPIGGEYLREQADVYVRNPTNLGFAPAVNQGLKIARGDWLVVSNNDIEFMHDWPHAAISAWVDGVGAISSHLHDSDPEHKVGIELAPWGHMFGALWLTRRDVLDRIGYLDETYERGMFEDKDFWRRLQSAGYKFRKVGWCKHIGNATWGKLPHQQEIYLANRDRYIAKWDDG